AAVFVRAPSPAQISVQSITANGTNTPVNLDNVRGQVDVTINVEPGEAKLERVDLVISNNGRDTTAATQSFAAAQAAARTEGLKRAKTLADSLRAVTAAVPIVLSFKTTSFDTTSGAVAFRNGPTAIKAVAVSSAPNGAKQEQASSGTAVRLN